MGDEIDDARGRSPEEKATRSLIDFRILALEKAHGDHETRLRVMEATVGKVEAIEVKLDTVNTKVDAVDTKVDRVAGKIDAAAAIASKNLYWILGSAMLIILTVGGTVVAEHAFPK